METARIMLFVDGVNAGHISVGRARDSPLFNAADLGCKFGT